MHWSPAMKAWIITRYADVKQVALNNKQISADRLTPFFKANPEYQRGSIEHLVRYLNHWMVFRDPPDHTRLRRLFTKAFTPTRGRQPLPNIEEIVAHLVDGMQAKARRGEPVDFIADFAYPLPASVIMDLLGVPRARPRTGKGLVRRHRAVHRHRPGRGQQVPARRDRRQGDVGLLPRPGRGARHRTDRRHDQPARAGARRPRCAVDRRDHRHLGLSVALGACKHNTDTVTTASVPDDYRSAPSDRGRRKPIARSWFSSAADAAAFPPRSAPT